MHKVFLPLRTLRLLRASAVRLTPVLWHGCLSTLFQKRLAILVFTLVFKIRGQSPCPNPFGIRLKAQTSLTNEFRSEHNPSEKQEVFFYAKRFFNS